MHYAVSSKIAFTLLAGLLLASCASMRTAPPVKPDLPAVPTHIKNCFASTVTLPKDGEWDNAKVAEVIAKLRQSELAKTRCGRQLIAYYEDLRKGLAEPKG